MKSTWTKGLSLDETKVMEKEFDASSLLRARLRLLTEGKINTARTAIISKHNYENAAWAYQQADCIGYERALNEIISLLEK